MDLLKCPWTQAERHALIGLGDQDLAQRIEAPLSQMQVSERWEATVRAAEARVSELEATVVHEIDGNIGARLNLKRAEARVAELEALTDWLRLHEPDAFYRALRAALRGDGDGGRDE